jgi:hypothetical protein
MFRDGRGTILIKLMTRDRLKELGRKGDSYDDILETMLAKLSDNPARDSHLNRIVTPDKEVASYGTNGGSSQE